MSGATPSAVAQPRQPGPPPAAPRSRMKRRVIVLMILVAIIAVGWSGFWWQASRTLDSLAQDFLENSARNGVTVRCEPRSVGGYPFLLDIRCGSFALVSNHAPTIAAGRLIAGARVYDPNRVVANLNGPLIVGDPAAPLGSLAWQRAQMSLDLQDGAVARGAVSIDHAVLKAGPIPATNIDLLEMHARRTPTAEGGTDLAWTAAGVRFPASSPLDGALLVTIEDGGATLLGAGLAVPIEGLPIDVTDFHLGNGITLVKAAGSLRLRPDGLIDGDLKATVIDPAGLPSLFAPFLPQNGALVAVAGAISAFGLPSEVDGKPARTLPIRIAASRVSIGMLTLATLPPIPVGN